MQATWTRQALRRAGALLLGIWVASGAYAADPATGGAPAPATPTADAELRNTVINLLDALVKKGILTPQQADALVADAQAKAAAAAKEESARAAAQAAAEKDAVRVTYVPQVVKDEIAAETAGQVRKDVTAEVIQTAKTQGWGVPGALPEWIKNVRFYGDVRIRAEDALYASGNAENFYLNWAAVNAAGGIGKAGPSALLNTTEDHPRLVGRLRLGGVAKLGDTLRADFRLAAGALGNPISTNQTLGNYDARWQVGVDKAALLWNPHSRSWEQELDLRLGRFDRPFATYNEMIWDVDVMSEGVSATWDWNRVRGWDERTSRWLFLTAGAFPLQDIELSASDKWLVAGQLGTEIPFSWDSKLLIAAAYYDFLNVTGQRNSPDSKLLDYTAPVSLQKGNTLFDIRNDTDPTTNLFALAGKYRLISGLLQLDLLAYGEVHAIISGEYVRNLGWTTADVLARTGQSVTARTTGYEAGVSFGYPRVSARGQWRAGVSYRNLQRDAVLDAFTDSDFHLGGTDARGYILSFDLGVARSAYTRLRYLSADEIDGPPLGIDVVQLDLVGQF